jgi:hypothetical protein
MSRCNQYPVGWRRQVFPRKFDACGPDIPSVAKHAGHPDALVDSKVDGLPTRIGCTAIDIGREAPEFNPISSLSVYKAFHQRVMHSPREG